MKFNVKKILIGFVIVIIIIMIVILLINSFKKNTATNVKNEKIKAQSKTYSKKIDLTEDSGIILSPTFKVLPSLEPSLIPSLKPSPTISAITPTETILSKNLTPSEESISTPAPQLLNSGIIGGTVAIFAVSLSLILFAFVF